MEVKIDFEKELKTYRKRYIYTIDFVKELAIKYKLAQYKVRNQFNDFLPKAYALDMSTMRTSEIFMTAREIHCCPKLRHSYISHVRVS